MLAREGRRGAYESEGRHHDPLALGRAVRNRASLAGARPSVMNIERSLSMPLLRKAGLMAVAFLALTLGGALTARADIIIAAPTF